MTNASTFQEVFQILVRSVMHVLVVSHSCPFHAGIYMNCSCASALKIVTFDHLNPPFLPNLPASKLLEEYLTGIPSKEQPSCSANSLGHTAFRDTTKKLNTLTTITTMPLQPPARPFTTAARVYPSLPTFSSQSSSRTPLNQATSKLSKAGKW